MKTKPMKLSTSNRITATTRIRNSDWPVETPIHMKPIAKPKFG